MLRGWQADVQRGRREGANGDVESANGALKRRLEQALLLRGSRELESALAYQAFIDEVVRKANAHRRRRVEEDLRPPSRSTWRPDKPTEISAACAPIQRFLAARRDLRLERELTVLDG